MAFVHWRKLDTGAVLMGGSVKTGKDVLLTGEAYADPPSTFTVKRRYGALIRLYRQSRGEGPTTALETLVAVPSGTDRAQAGPVALRTPGRRLKWRMFFEDDLGNASNELNVSRLGNFAGTVGVAVEPGRAQVETTFTAVVDPEVKMSLLSPWSGEEFDEFVDELVEDAATDGDSPGAYEGLREFIAPLMPAEAPTGWRVTLRQERLMVDEGESIRVQADFQLPTPGVMIFALQMTAEVDGELITSSSDPLAIHVPEDGGQAAILFGDDGGRPGGKHELEPANHRALALLELAARERA
ncbi:MAG TPA: hypothetical protein VLL27_09795 [Solirubrobacterales bacterium]|nr:hypothetical protein [Solirubrobacterales bacterium]